MNKTMHWHHAIRSFSPFNAWHYDCQYSTSLSLSSSSYHRPADSETQNTINHSVPFTFIHTQNIIRIICVEYLPSVFWCCWLGDRKGIHYPACKKLEWWGTGVVIRIERDADLHMAQLMPLPLTVSCFSKIQIGFTFLIPAYSGSPGKRAVITGVCVCIYVSNKLLSLC